MFQLETYVLEETGILDSQLEKALYLFPCRLAAEITRRKFDYPNFSLGNNPCTILE